MSFPSSLCIWGSLGRLINRWWNICFFIGLDFSISFCRRGWAFCRQIRGVDRNRCGGCTFFRGPFWWGFIRLIMHWPLTEVLNTSLSCIWSFISFRVPLFLTIFWNKFWGLVRRVFLQRLAWFIQWILRLWRSTCCVGIWFSWGEDLGL